MVDAIKHSPESKVMTAGWSAIKGGLTVAVIALGLGALIGGGIAASFAGATAGVIAASALTGATLAGVAGYFGGTTTAVLLGIGALVGLGKGSNRISRETEAYREKAMNSPAVVQQAYLAGVQAGAQEKEQNIMAQLQQAQAQMVQEQQMAAAVANKANCGHHTSAQLDRRAAQAAVGPQVGA